MTAHDIAEQGLMWGRIGLAGGCVGLLFGLIGAAIGMVARSNAGKLVELSNQLRDKVFDASRRAADAESDRDYYKRMFEASRGADTMMNSRIGEITHDSGNGEVVIEFDSGHVMAQIVPPGIAYPNLVGVDWSTRDGHND